MDCPRELLVDWGGALNYDLFPPARPLEPFRKLKIAQLLTHTRSPFVRRRFQQYGIVDPYRELGEHANVVLIAWDHLPSLLTIYGREHYGVEITATLVRDYGFFHVYRLHTVHP
jgi:hypothetical protein